MVSHRPRLPHKFRCLPNCQGRRINWQIKIRIIPRPDSEGLSLILRLLPLNHYGTLVAPGLVVLGFGSLFRKSSDHSLLCPNGPDRHRSITVRWNLDGTHPTSLEDPGARGHLETVPACNTANMVACYQMQVIVSTSARYYLQYFSPAYVCSYHGNNKAHQAWRRLPENNNGINNSYNKRHNYSH